MGEIKELNFNDMLMKFDYPQVENNLCIENELYFDIPEFENNKFESQPCSEMPNITLDDLVKDLMGIDNVDIDEKTSVMGIDNVAINENDVTSSHQFIQVPASPLFSSEIHNFTNIFSNQQIAFVNLNDLKESFSHETMRKDDMYVICIHLKNSILRCNVTRTECIPENKKNNFLRLEFSDFEKHLLSLEEQFGNIFQNLPVMLIYFAQKRQKNLYHQMYINKFEKVENALKKFKSVLGVNYNPLKKELEGILNPAKKRIRRIKKKSIQ